LKEKVMKKNYIALMIGILGLAGGVSNANAHDSIGLSINLGGPAYYAPAPVYVASPPVYYAPQPVVYYRPSPVYYGPNAFFRYDDEPHYRDHHDNGHHHGWRRNIRHDDD
jgi:hypothetical protein